jgi:DNA-binding LacI/PurR family transcriptional regulator
VGSELTAGHDNENLTQRVIRGLYCHVQVNALRSGDRLPTNRDLAQELRVSTLTVQRALKILEKCGAVQCRRRRGTFLVDAELIGSPRVDSGIIGLLCPTATPGFYMDILVELEQVLSENGKLLGISFTRHMPDREFRLLNHMMRQRYEALIYVTSPAVALSDEYSERVSEWVTRYTSEGTFVLFVSICPRGQEERLISMDNRAAGRELSRALLEKGHRRIAYVGVPELAASYERIEGCRDTLRENGQDLTDADVVSHSMLTRSGVVLELRQKLHRFLVEHPEVTGFVVDNDMVAHLVRSLLHEVRKSRTFAPKDSIAGVHVLERVPFQAVRWLRPPGRLLGRRAAEIAVHAPSADHVPGRILVPPTWS